MQYMCYVRPSPCPAPNLQSSPSPARCLHRGRRRPRLLARTLVPHRMPSFRLSAVRVGVQPAAELRYLQRHRHALHVQRALFPVPCPQSAVELAPARWTPVCWPAPSSRTVCPPFDARQGASVFNQPLSFDTSRVTTMHGMFYVRSSPCSATNLQPRPPLHGACASVVRRLLPLGPQLAPHRMPSVRLSAARVGVQPAAELRHVQRHNHGVHVPGALLPLPFPQSTVEPSPARCVRRGCPPLPASRPAAHLAPYALLPTLGRARGRSTSR